MSVLEASIGFQYDRAMTCETDMFIRLVQESQMRRDIGSPTNSTTDIGPEGISLWLGISR